jgi:hypothetical protein
LRMSTDAGLAHFQSLFANRIVGVLVKEAGCIVKVAAVLQR